MTMWDITDLRSSSRKQSSNFKGLCIRLPHFKEQRESRLAELRTWEPLLKPKRYRDSQVQPYRSDCSQAIIEKKEGQSDTGAILLSHLEDWIFYSIHVVNKSHVKNQLVLSFFFTLYFFSSLSCLYSLFKRSPLILQYTQTLLSNIQLIHTSSLLKITPMMSSGFITCLTHVSKTFRCTARSAPLISLYSLLGMFPFRAPNRERLYRHLQFYTKNQPGFFFSAFVKKTMVCIRVAEMNVFPEGLQQLNITCHCVFWERR